VNNVQDLLLTIKEVLPLVVLTLFFWGTIDNYFLTRYGGKLNRGFTIWQKPLLESDKNFLLDLQEDVIDETKVRWRTKVSFIAKADNQVLIRYTHPHQRTSWPFVFYVDLSSPEPKLEYRLSLPMLCAGILLSLMNIIVFAILTTAFVFTVFMEVIGVTDYLSHKADLYMYREKI
jgi:hypothetical protein